MYTISQQRPFILQKYSTNINFKNEPNDPTESSQQIDLIEINRNIDEYTTQFSIHIFDRNTFSSVIKELTRETLSEQKKIERDVPYVQYTTKELVKMVCDRWADDKKMSNNKYLIPSQIASIYCGFTVDGMKMKLHRHLCNYLIYNVLKNMPAK